MDITDVKVYYLREGKPLSEEHKRRISVAMKSHYRAQPMTLQHKQKIAASMREVWKYWKQCWKDDGLI